MGKPEPSVEERRTDALSRVGELVEIARQIDDEILAEILATSPGHWSYRPLVESVVEFKKKVFSK
jgi:hypothetical protein